jgi:YHS domain-containing protein
MNVLMLPVVCASLLLALWAPIPAFATDPQQAAKPAATAPAKTAAPTAERDPMCGMSVDPATAKAAGRTSVYEGKTYYFCNDACKKEFDADPAKFAAQAAAGTASGTQGCCCGCCGGNASGTGSTGRMCGRRMR